MLLARVWRNRSARSKSHICESTSWRIVGSGNSPAHSKSLAKSAPQVGADDRDELCQDGIAIAASLLANSEARGKTVSAGNVSYYAAKLVRQGRRSTGQSTTDAMSPRSQIVGRCRVESLDQPIAGDADGDDLCLHDVLAAGSADPSQEAAKRLDWKPLVASLDATARKILCMANCNSGFVCTLKTAL
jgi:hypothetical protein